MCSRAYVTVPVTTVWTSPSAPRDVDGWAVAPRRWSAGPSDQRWVQIVAPMQPSRLDARGYPGWVLAGHRGDKVPDRRQRASATMDSGDAAHAQAFIEAARAHLGIPYLWGEMCDAARDCSGLVHLSLRRLGWSCLETPATSTTSASTSR